MTDRRSLNLRDLAMKQMYEAGASTTEVGRTFGVGSPQVSRRLRLIGTEMRPFHAEGETHNQWRGNRIKYSGAHMRVRAQRGSASQFTCACGAPARQWAYDHLDPEEMPSPLGPYSADPAHYEPLCVPCHKVADLARIAERSAS